MKYWKKKWVGKIILKKNIKILFISNIVNNKCTDMGVL